MTSIDTPQPSFCETAAARTGALRQAIGNHPFNVALREGALDAERFVFYLAQDARYLIGFSRVLAAAAMRAPGVEAAAFFAQSSRTALIVERSLHEGELQRLGWDAERLAGIPTSPSGLAYSSFLGSVAATEPWPVLVAAVLPCYWVYQEVGLEIAERTAGVPGHPYRAWIDTYSDEEFGSAVATARRIADDAAADSTPSVVEQMLERFGRATAYEWMFWDSAWRLEAWPTAEWLPEVGRRH